MTRTSAVHVKICGLRDEAMLEHAIEAGADHVGFVHYAKSPRHLDIADIRKLGTCVANRATRWVVTAKPSVELLLAIRDLVVDGCVDGLQVHGAADEAAMNEVAKAGLIMRANAVASREDVQTADLATHVNSFLFDAKPRPDDKLPGGNGTSFDWSIMSALDRTALAGRPWFLAGGLTPENVREAVEISNADAVDVSSGVESAPGVKSPEKVVEFIRAAKSV